MVTVSPDCREAWSLSLIAESCFYRSFAYFLAIPVFPWYKKGFSSVECK